MKISAEDIAFFGALAAAAFAGLFVGANTGMMIAAAALVALAAYRKPWEALLVLLFAAPVLPLMKATGFLSAGTLLKDFAIAAIAARVMLPALGARNWRYFTDRLSLAAYFLAAVSLAGFISAGGNAMVLRLRDIILYLPLFWSARIMIGGGRPSRDIIRALAAGFAAVAAAGLIQWFVFPEGMVRRFIADSSLWVPRLSATLAHPNNLGAYLVMLTPLLAALALFSARKRIFAAAAIAALLMAYLTYSRGAWLGIAVAAVVLIFLVTQRNARRRTGAALLLLAAAAAALTIPRTRSVIGTALDLDYASNRERADILMMIVSDTDARSAIIGRGLGRIDFSATRNASLGAIDILKADADAVRTAKAKTFTDNAVLKAFLETGVLGIAAYGLAIYGALYAAASAARTKVLGRGVIFLYAYIAATAGLFALSFFLDVPEVFPVQLYWWIASGAVAAISDERKTDAA